MTVNLGNFQKQNNPQTSLLSNVNFLAKNNITVNNPTQTHFSVQGVQSYAPQEIKAIKLRQDRLQQNKEGQYIPLKTVLLSDQIIEWPQQTSDHPKNKKIKNRPESAKQPKFYKMKQPSDEPLKQYLKKRREQRINKKNAVSTNNQAVIKYEKNIAKKEALDYKLQKMQKQYKEYFKDVKLGSHPLEKAKKEQFDEPDQKDNSQSNGSQNQEDVGQKSVRPSTTKNQTRKPKQQNNFLQNQSDKFSEGQESQQNRSQASQNVFAKMVGGQNKKKGKQKNNKDLNLGFDLINNCTSYSQKLGTAIHQMFI